MNLFTKKDILIALLSLGVFALCVSAFQTQVLAQTTSAPIFMVSWQANNYAPADFMGKLLPIENTPIEVAFNLLRNGKFISLSQTEIRWYVNSQLAQGGIGKQEFKFTALERSGGNQEIRIDIPNYQGSNLVHTFTIPVVSPEVVISVPLLSSHLPYGEVAIEALPYFFNISNLNKLTLRWFVNGEEPKSSEEITSPTTLTLQTTEQIPIGTQTEIKVSTQNRNRATEFAEQITMFVVTK